MLYGNSRSKIIHTQSCGFRKIISLDNGKWFYSIDDAKPLGYKQCKCCSAIGKQAHLRSKSMINYCHRNGLSPILKDGSLYIQSSLSCWIITINKSNKIELWHRNTRGNKYQYHIQNCKSKTVMEMMEYIVQHDDYRSKNPLPAEKKKKAPPKKGTKRYRTQQRREKKSKKRQEISRVLSLIEGLSVAYS